MTAAMSLDIGSLLPLAVALVAAGIVVGFMSGLLGIGGGGILVPVLYETFALIGVDPAIRMHMALATSLAVIVPTSVRSFSAHHTRGSVDVDILRRLGPWVVGGVFVGILVAESASTLVLKWIWIVFGTVMALKMAFGRDTWRLGTQIPKGPGVEAYGILVGAVSVLISIGGAAFIVALMTLYGQPVLLAVGTSSGFGPLISVPGVIGYIWAGWGDPRLPPLSLGYVSLIGAALIIPMSVFVAPFGVRMAHGIPKRSLEIAFAIFLAVVVSRFLWLALAEV
ncbi:MAG: sulfite exporter TauE/SafE family protein [Hyphomicrobiaceae bacterium]|nr:sulfite exporter TauE/SafE family protein [Hyphomicrobiaceae bacterium]